MWEYGVESMSFSPTPVPVEFLSALTPIGHNEVQQPIEPFAMIRLLQVTQFVGNNVINAALGKANEEGV